MWTFLYYYGENSSLRVSPTALLKMKDISFFLLHNGRQEIDKPCPEKKLHRPFPPKLFYTELRHFTPRVSSRRPVASPSLTSCCPNLTRLWGAECCRTLPSGGPEGSRWQRPPPCPPGLPADLNMWQWYISAIVRCTHSPDACGQINKSSL